MSARQYLIQPVMKKPYLILLTLLTLGLFVLVINALMLMLTAGLVGNAMSIAGEGIAKLGWAIVGSLVISIATMLIGWILPEKG